MKTAVEETHRMVKLDTGEVLHVQTMLFWELATTSHRTQNESVRPSRPNQEEKATYPTRGLDHQAR